MAQLALDDMPRRLFSCTPTRLTTWVDCPRRYRFTYVDRPTPPRAGPWAHLSLGNSVHLALREWWRLPPPERTTATAAGLLRQNWVAEGYRDDAQSGRWQEMAADWVSGYVAGVDPDSEPVGLERTVAMRTSSLALSGRVDRIDLRDDEAVVVDYKTGRRPPADLDVRAELPLALYALATQATLRRPCRRVELHHVPSGTAAGWTHDDRTLRRHLARAEAIGAEAADAEGRASRGSTGAEVFPARPSASCGWCEFRSSCPEGRTASQPQLPWSLLGADASGRSSGFTVGRGRDTPGMA